ncbi:MAG: Ppx/GppA family phosphatase [Phocaeicola sp.]
MGTVHYAAIDIGSNAARLLIKSVDPDAPEEKRFKKKLMVRVPLRLGFDVFSMGELSEKKEKNLRRLMKSFENLMKIYEVDDYRACATSAMRDARNGKEIIKKIEKSTNIRIEIIDGKEEARMVYSNHLECASDRVGNFVYVDVGGGSTEVNFMTDSTLLFSQSYNLGTVRMLSEAVTPETWIQMEEDLKRVTAGYSDINIIGSGGNINKLYRLSDQKDSANLRLPITSLQQMYDMLKGLTLSERMEQFEMKEDRADVIVPAAEIFLKIASSIQAEYVHVPVIGLSDGIIDELYTKNFVTPENSENK